MVQSLRRPVLCLIMPHLHRGVWLPSYVILLTDMLYPYPYFFLFSPYIVAHYATIVNSYIDTFRVFQKKSIDIVSLIIDRDSGDSRDCRDCGDRYIDILGLSVVPSLCLGA